MMGSVLTIKKDGTGSVRDYSALRGEESWDIVWSHMGPGNLQIFQFWEGENSDITDERWDNVHYEAAWIESDVSDRVPILKYREHDSFWIF